MAKGTVKWFNATKGYGFITPDDSDKDAFVHISEVERSGLGRLIEGQRINFQIRQEARGLKAVELTPDDSTAARYSRVERLGLAVTASAGPRSPKGRQAGCGGRT